MRFSRERGTGTIRPAIHEYSSAIYISFTIFPAQSVETYVVPSFISTSRTSVKQKCADVRRKVSPSRDSIPSMPRVRRISACPRHALYHSDASQIFLWNIQVFIAFH